MDIFCNRRNKRLLVAQYTTRKCLHSKGDKTDFCAKSNFFGVCFTIKRYHQSTVCQLGQCSDISATTVFQVKTSLSGFNRLWGDTRVMWTHFFTFWISGCVSEMAQKWSILGKNPQFSSLGATEAQDGW